MLPGMGRGLDGTQAGLRKRRLDSQQEPSRPGADIEQIMRRRPQAAKIIDQTSPDRHVGRDPCLDAGILRR